MVDLLLCQPLLPGAQAHRGKLCKASGWRLCWCQEHVHIVLQSLHSTTQRWKCFDGPCKSTQQACTIDADICRHACIHDFMYSFIHSFTGLHHWSLTSDDPAECAYLLHTDSVSLTKHAILVLDKHAPGHSSVAMNECLTIQQKHAMGSQAEHS